MNYVTTMTERTRTLLEEVWNQGNLDAITDLIAPRYTIHHDPGDPWDGQTLDRQGYVDRVRQSRMPFPDQKFTVVDSLGDDRRVFITWTWQGTHVAAVGAFEPTGKVIRMSGATVYYHDNGLFTGHWQIVDRLSVFAQLRRQS
jgi:steroid delta-isomerase-like uncharacterized protein